MSPSIITDSEGKLVLVAGSMGGSTIIASVARTIIGVLDWKQSPQDAVGTSAVFARTPEIIVETSRMAPAMADALRERDWNIVEDTRIEDALYSGTHVIRVTPEGLVGGADPRLEGKAVALPPR